MTDSNTENSTPLVEDNNPKPARASRWLLLASVISFVFSVSVAVFSVYFYQNHLSNSSAFEQKNQTLSEQLANQEQRQKQYIQKNSSENSSLKAQVAQLNQQLLGLNNKNKLITADIQALQRKVSETNVKQPNDWILSEVEYLLNLAGRKLWLEHDVETSIALLSDADKRIVEMRDPSLNSLRRAILEDIHTLEELPKRDLDKIALALSSLERRVNKLVVNNLTMPDAGDNQSTDVSADINDWQANLEKSWHTFVNSFIVISHRDTPVQALLSPEQHWYLKENLINQLAKAQFAVYREEQDAYDESLKNAGILVETYYDMSNKATKQFYDTLTRLSKQKITIKLPDQFKSASRLTLAIKQRESKSFPISSEEKAQ